MAATSSYGSSTSTISSCNKDILRLFEILRAEGRWKGSPGFTHALHLNYERLSPDRFHFDKQTLTFRYCLSSQLSLAKYENITSLATFMAIVEEVTTWALILANPKQPRPGISVSLQLESGPVKNLPAGAFIEIRAKVSKTGRDLGFVEVEVMEICSSEMICFGTHIKHLSSNTLRNALLSPIGWPFWNLCSKILPEPLPSTFRLQELFESLDYQCHTRALFTATEAHATTLSPMHVRSHFPVATSIGTIIAIAKALTTTNLIVLFKGGCQAIVMEMLGRQVAKHELAAPAVHVQVAHISYQSPPTKTMEVSAVVLSLKPPFVSMRIRLRRVEDGQLASQGIFRFVNAIDDEYITDATQPYQRYNSGTIQSWDTSTTRHAKNVVIYSIDSTI